MTQQIQSGTGPAAIISDIHANLEALEAVLLDIQKHQCEKIVCLGDVVGYGPNPRECIARLRELSIPAIRGNHDAACSANAFPSSMNPVAGVAVVWTQSVLREEEKEWLRNLPLVLNEEDTTFVHASPRCPADWTYILRSRDADSAFGSFDGKFCFIGHTHQPVAWIRNEHQLANELFDRLVISETDRYLINVGSVGQPRDNDPRAAYVLFDRSKGIIELRRVPYDFRKTQEKILAAQLPRQLAERLEHGW